MSEPWKSCSLSMDQLCFHTDKQFSPISQRLLHRMNMLSCCLKLGKNTSVDINFKKKKISSIHKLVSICGDLLLVISWNQESSFFFVFCFILCHLWKLFLSLLVIYEKAGKLDLLFSITQKRKHVLF